MIHAVSRVQARIDSIEQRFTPAAFTPAAFSAALQRASAVTAGAGGAAAASPPTGVGPQLGAAGVGTVPASGYLGGTGAMGPARSPALQGWQQALPPAALGVLPQLEAAATAAGVDPRLLASLTWAESAFRPDARSSAGAIGLTQLMPATAAGLGVDPHDPVQNLAGGARYLRQQLDRFGSVELALAAYNAGPGRVARAGGVPAIRETQDYVARVTRHLETLGATP